MSLVVTAGQRADSPQFHAVLEAIRVPRLWVGRPRTRPDWARAVATRYDKLAVGYQAAVQIAIINDWPTCL